VQKKQSIMAGHVAQFLADPGTALKQVLPRMEKDFGKFIKATELVFKKDGLVETAADMLGAGGVPNVTALDRKMFGLFEEFGKIEPAVKCVLPAIRYSTNDPEFNAGRQKLANGLHGFYTKLIKPLETKMVDAALETTMAIFEKKVLGHDGTKEVLQYVRGHVQTAHEASMKEVNTAMAKLQTANTWADQQRLKSQLEKTVQQTQKKSASLWTLEQLVPNIINPLKDFGFKVMIQEMVKQFHMMYDSIFTWGGPMILRAATVALDTLCATGNVALEWLCSGGLELAQDVFFWTTQQLRILSKEMLVGMVTWIVDFADEHVYQVIEKEAGKGLRALDEVADREAHILHKEAERLTAKWPDFSKLVPPAIKRFINGLFVQGFNLLKTQVLGSAGTGAEKVFNAMGNYFGRVRMGGLSQALEGSCAGTVTSSGSGSSGSEPEHVGPTQSPTRLPTTHTPTDFPTEAPSVAPTVVPTPTPTRTPTEVPTTQDPTTDAPSYAPTHTPTIMPSHQPSHAPSMKPTASPTRVPSDYPTHAPSAAKCWCVTPGEGTEIKCSDYVAGQTRHCGKNEVCSATGHFEKGAWDQACAVKARKTGGAHHPSDDSSDATIETAEITCKCVTPNAGTKGHNQFSCSAGPNTQTFQEACPEDETCVATEQFRFGDNKKACKKTVMTVGECQEEWHKCCMETYNMRKCSVKFRPCFKAAREAIAR
jgi:hypothetical protein